MRTECEKFENLMPDYDWLDEKDRKELIQHICACGECEAKFKAVEIFGEILAERSQETMENTDLTENVMSIIKGKENKSYSILSFAAALVVFEAAILVFLDPRLMETVNMTLDAVGLSDEYISVIGEYFSSSIPFSFDLSLSGYLNIEMIIITIIAGIVLSFPAIRFFDERRISK